MAQCVELIQHVRGETVDQDLVEDRPFAMPHTDGEPAAESAATTLEGPNGYGG